MNGWIKYKILTHWKCFGKAKTFVHRDYKNNTVTIDYCNGGSCTKYTYHGKYIAG